MDKPILQIFDRMPAFLNAKENLQRAKGPVAVYGLQDASKAHMAAALGRENAVLYLCASEAAAISVYEKIRMMLPASLFLPREIPLVHVMNVSGTRTVQRAGAISEMLFGECPVIVSCAEAVMQRLAPKEAYRKMCTLLKTGDEISPRNLVEKLCRSGYEHVELVEGRGQVAARGDIVDVYAPQMRYPVRIEFWGDSIDQMRDFDPVSQISVEQRMEVVLPPAYETPQPEEAVERARKLLEGKEGFEAQLQAWDIGLSSSGADIVLPLLYENPESVFDYLPENTLFLLDEPKRIEESARISEHSFAENITTVLERGEGDSRQAELLMCAADFTAGISKGRTLAFYMLPGSSPAFPVKETVQIAARPVVQYLGDMQELLRDLEAWKKTEESVVLYAGENADTLLSQLNEEGISAGESEKLDRLPERGEILLVREDLNSGFSYPELHITVLGEKELFGKNTSVKTKSRKAGLSFSELKPGDYIVHESHGIGRFAGVEALTVQGNTRDYLLLEYKGGDRLYIPTDQLDRVQKYVGGGDEDYVPALSRLGGGEWQNRVTKAKTAAKKLAVDLAALYAARVSIPGFAFSKDSAWQIQMEERFPYRETPDQAKSILEIKQDMEKGQPMDRLLCGDVGYGKTEVAMRAAFKAVQDSKQVAVLVPTTILAQQHYNNFVTRLADFPVRIGCISRFQSAAQKKAVKEKLKTGEIDIVIGTHALLAKDVVFSDLGLLIIDEEHRFGVNHKEKLKDLRKQIDVLTLTATPIPRTLNLSMTGIRDISVIETPPEGRYPVQTMVMEYTDGLLVDAVTKEMGRGGQVYLVSNKVDEMEYMAGKVRKLLPDASVLIAHGQMPEHQLEQAMMDFMEKKADILLCSTIIESGLDLPNVNTMIVLDADRMGLAQLYQLRGRIGRGTRIGYAYLTIQRGKVVNEKAQKRLKAIREFTQFGAGFQLAVRDLEIRGAGSFLGAEQHGHIADIGYEYYLKLIRSAVREAEGLEEQETPEVQIDIPLNAHIPHDYIESEVQRLAIYRRISSVRDEKQELELKEELEDRYGEIPEPVENLFLLERIKTYASKAGILQLGIKDGFAKFGFGEETGLDGERLLKLLSETPGARLIASVPPAITISRPQKKAEELVGFLPQFLHGIVHCIVRD